MKLQLAISRFDRLTPAAQAVFRQPGWVHLGDPPGRKPSVGKARELWRDYGWLNFGKICMAVLRRKLTAQRARTARPDAGETPYPEVRPFYYRKGDRLDFADGEFDFIYAEHFFEHLFLDAAIALLRECHRLLAPGGVMRIASPDADLRRDHPPEPAGFPWIRMPFTHPEKHRSRWSVYSLAEALRLAGLRPVPLRYYDEGGVGHDHPPAEVRAQYPAVLKEEEAVLTLTYLQHPRSLIVDGVKEP